VTTPHKLGEKSHPANTSADIEVLM
jgi:hypothetical protein